MGRRVAPRVDMELGELADAVVARSVDDVLRFDPRQVHRFRVATRRLRSDLRTFRRCFDADELDDVRRELRWLGRVAGAVRDMEVLGERLTSRSDRVAPADRAGLARLVERCDAERARRTDALVEALASRRFVRLCDSLRRLLDPDARPDEVLRFRGRRAAKRTKLVAAQSDRLARAVATLRASPSGDSLRKPTDEELHHVRILAKRCRYACEAFVDVVGDDARRLARAMARVQSLLGDHADSVAAEAWLREEIAACRDLEHVARDLIELEHGERARLRDAWAETWRRSSRRRLREWF